MACVSAAHQVTKNLFHSYKIITSHNSKQVQLQSLLRESNSVSQLKNVGSPSSPTLVRIREHLHSCHPLLCWEGEWTATYNNGVQTNSYYYARTSVRNMSIYHTVEPLMKDTLNKGHNRNNYKGHTLGPKSILLQCSPLNSNSLNTNFLLFQSNQYFPTIIQYL